MDANDKRYSQWSAQKLNNAVDALTQDWHRNENKLNSILCFHLSKQMPKHSELSLPPNEISSWLISLLQWLPVREQL
jgi:hypothetical protein